MNANNPYNKELSDKYKLKYRPDHPHQFMAYSTWLEEIGDIKGLKVLDLACGSGTSSRMLAEKGSFVVGVDISESMLEEARKTESDNQMGIEYIHADTSVAQKYKEEPFDIVVAAFMLHYASSQEMFEGFLRNVAINLKPGGRFVTINLSPEHPVVESGKGISHSSKWVGEPFKNGSIIEVVLWTKDNEEICTLTEYHRSKENYEKTLQKVGLNNIKWVELRMHEEGKKLDNWRELEKRNMLVVLEAIKE